MSVESVPSVDWNDDRTTVSPAWALRFSFAVELTENSRYCFRSGQYFMTKSIAAKDKAFALWAGLRFSPLISKEGAIWLETAKPHPLPTAIPS